MSAPPPGVESGPPGWLLRVIQDQRIAFLVVGLVNTAIGFVAFFGFDDLFTAYRPGFLDRFGAVGSDANAAVSYTHLDVYKRQLLHSPLPHGGTALRESFQWLAKNAFSMRYYANAARMLGLHDLLAGPDHLAATLADRLPRLRSCLLYTSRCV